MGNYSWRLQLAEGTAEKKSGLIRFGVKSIEEERKRLFNELNISDVQVYSREEVPVKWCTFSDPWGNLLGLFEYIDKKEECERIHTILKK